MFSTFIPYFLSSSLPHSFSVSVPVTCCLPKQKYSYIWLFKKITNVVFFLSCDWCPRDSRAPDWTQGLSQKTNYTYFSAPLCHTCAYTYIYTIYLKHTYTQNHLKKSHLQSIRFHKCIFWMKSSGAYTYAHTRCSDQYNSLFRIINFHCNTINISVNPVF